jgi:hypothetical protein
MLVLVGLSCAIVGPRDSLAGYEQEVLADGPVVYYRFEEASGTQAIDSSGNGYDGDYIDGVDLGLPSADVGLGSAALFDGMSGYVQLPNLGLETDQLTVEAWVNLEFLAPGCCTSIFSPDGWQAGWLHYNIKDNQNIEFALNGGGPNNHNTEPESVPFEEWIYFASVYDKDEALVRTYINGEEVDVTPPDFTSPQTVRLIAPAQVAAWEGGRFLGGLLDEFAIYNAALTEDRIVAHFEAASSTGVSLMAGDADMDFDFDQLDLVKVQIAGKYLTGQSATWGEGDWDGAPGGEPGTPPIGNGFFDQLDIIAALNAGKYLQGPYAAIAQGGVQDDALTSIVYHAASGEVSVDAPAGLELTSVNIESASGIFTGKAAENLGGSFDNDSDTNIFKATFGDSFGSLSFGNVAQPRLSEDFVANDLTVVGSLTGGGNLGEVDLVYIPEPSAGVLLALGMIGLLARRRARP